MRRVALLVVLLLASSACGDDCQNPLCIDSREPVTKQGISVTGIETATFTTGRGTCESWTVSPSGTIAGYRNFRLWLQVPADKPRYAFDIYVFRYQGPGSEAPTRTYYPAGYSGPYITATAVGQGLGNATAAGQAYQQATEAIVQVNSDGYSGSMTMRFPDRTFTGTWRCVRPWYARSSP